MATFINTTFGLQENFDSVNQAPRDALRLVFKQTLPGNQIKILTAAIFRSASYDPMIQDNPQLKILLDQET